MKSLKQSRREFQKILESVISPYGGNVYFQPPENIKLKFPCILFEVSSMDLTHADNTLYERVIQFSVMYISKTTNEDVVDKLTALPYSWFERHFVQDGLNHYIFRIFY